MLIVLLNGKIPIMELAETRVSRHFCQIVALSIVAKPEPAAVDYSV